MSQNKVAEPNNTAVRTALWRALHMQVDGAPPVFEDKLGLRLASPEEGWQNRPDMDPGFTRRLRASVVSRARFVEDLLISKIAGGVTQYVILGAGLDTFAQRHTDPTSAIQVYEIDAPGTQMWKKQQLRLTQLPSPDWLHFVAVDFEKSGWWEALKSAGFDHRKPAFVSCTGVSLYLTKEAIRSTLSTVARMATGSTLAMTFYLPLELLDSEDQPLQEIALKGSREAGTPMISFFTPKEIGDFAAAAGFMSWKTVSTNEMESLYFKNRSDGLVPASGEIFLVASC